MYSAYSAVEIQATIFVYENCGLRPIPLFNSSLSVPVC